MKKVCTILATAILASLLSGQVMGQATFTSASSGTWGSASTWTITSGSDADGIPDSDDNVVVTGRHTITVSASASCNNLTLNGAPGSPNNSDLTTVSLSGNVTLAVAGTVTLSSPSNGGGNFNGFTQINVGTGTLTSATITMAEGSGKNFVRINTGAGGRISFTQSLLVTNQSNNSNNIFDISAGGILQLGNASGSWTGGITAGTQGIFDFNASSGVQTIPAITYPNLTLSGGSAKTAPGAITVNGVLRLVNGILTTTSSNLLTLGINATVPEVSDVSFVNGPVRKTLNSSSSAFIFPIGNTGAGYRPIAISGVANKAGGGPSAARSFTAEFVRNDPQGLSQSFSNGITAINRREYWSLNLDDEASYTAEIGWNNSSGINSTIGLTPAVRNLTTSNAWGRPTTNGSVEVDFTNKKMRAQTNSLISNQLRFDFTYGSTAAGASFPTLPVTFGAIKATEKNRGVQIDWTSYSEQNLANYQVERSADGIHFSSIGEVMPRNVAEASNYSFFDAQPLSGTSFYRIRNNDIDGKSGLSTIVKMNLNKNIKTINVYPNPVRGNLVSFQTSDLAKGLYSVDVYNTMGSRVFSQAINHPGGAITQGLNLPNLQSGSYTLRINGTSTSSIHKITILQ